jgi:hypothetical protein
MVKIIVLASLWLLAVPPGVAVPQTAPKAAPAPVHQRAPAPAPAQPAKPRLSDAQIETAIRAKFAKSKSANKFTVHVQGGVASIEGKTDVVQHKGVATRMAKTAGALAVNNHVEVSEAARKKAAGNLEEGRRRVQVKRGDSRNQR